MSVRPIWHSGIPARYWTAGKRNGSQSTIIITEFWHTVENSLCKPDLKSVQILAR